MIGRGSRGEERGLLVWVLGFFGGGGCDRERSVAARTFLWLWVTKQGGDNVWVWEDGNPGGIS